MMCDAVQDQLELYALGVLESGEGQMVAEHLASGCADCGQALERALQQNLLVAKSVPLVDPPARLRLRVKEAIQPEKGVRRLSWLPWSLVAAAAAVALVIGLTLGGRLREENRATQREAVERARLEKTIEIIRAPGTRQVTLHSAAVSGLKGAMYVHRGLGLALVIDQLPKAPAGWRYESWVVPKQGTPQPLERIGVESGHAVSVLQGPVDVEHVAALALSMEREGEVSTKPTTLVLTAAL